ncbi:MAG: DUF4351 domain-containing protein [Chromatiales bacterium]|nr:DUF4351 domain-containing protein [Chromatiales bacterium]
MTADTPNSRRSLLKSDYDSPWKEALERFFPEFLALLFPAIHARIDWRVPPEFLDKELQQIGAASPRGRRYADKLVRVQALDGQAIAVLIHVEVQGDPESDFGERMFVYQTRLRDRYGLDVVSLAVLTDTTASFRPSQFRHRRWGCGIAFRFPMVKLLDYVDPDRWAELDASDNLFALVVMAQIRAKVTDEAETLKGWKFRLIRRMYERGYSETLILELLPPHRLDDPPAPGAGSGLSSRHSMPTRSNCRMPYVTTVEQAGIEKGVQRGEATILIRLFSRKFGPEAVETYRSRIESAEPEQLEAWSERILTADTPETIFH